MGTERLDIDQKRALYAYDCAELGKNKDKYDSYIQSLPMMIHNSGLRNTLAFAYSNGFLKEKKNPTWQLIFEHLVYWFVSDKEVTGSLKHKFAKDFDKLPANLKAQSAMTIIIGLEDYEYRLAIQETIAVLNWIRKLVKS
jgi:CRISPR type III-B/RAMP module-associated protein Cmr5